MKVNLKMIKETVMGYYYFNGNRYEGEFKSSSRIEGYGIFYSSNGDKYEGESKNNKSNGIGILYYSNGDKYESEWKNNKFVWYILFFFRI